MAKKKQTTLIDFSKVGISDDYKMYLKEAKEQLQKIRPINPTKDESKLNQKAIDVAIATMEAYENIIELMKDFLSEVMTDG